MNSRIFRTRMAPSPTGEMHVGSMATLLKNYAFAKKHGGKFVLRIEDTDKTREIEGGVQKILDVIKSYGLDWDEGPVKGGPHEPYTQSQRLDIYRQKATELVEKRQAYYCFCTKERLEEVREQQKTAKQPPRYDRHCRRLSAEEVDEKISRGESCVIRLKVPDNEPITFNDLIRGDITFHSSEIDDQVLIKSDGYPTYHLGVVVDDYLMEITHIMRGEEWISSTPKHILLYQAFGWPVPIFAHIPIFLNPDGKGKMSKRQGMVSAQSFLDRGYLPEAMLNFFMILGWAREDEREVMDVDEYITEFDPSHISAKSVAFDLKKLDWMNGVYIRKLTGQELTERAKQFLPTDFPVDKLDQILPLIAERLDRLDQIEELTDFFYRTITLDKELLLKKADTELVNKQLGVTADELEKLKNWNHDQIEQVVRNLQERNNWPKSQYFMMVRIAVTSKKATPPLFETMAVLGQKQTISRLKQAQNIVK